MRLLKNPRQSQRWSFSINTLISDLGIYSLRNRNKCRSNLNQNKRNQQKVYAHVIIWCIFTIKTQSNRICREVWLYWQKVQWTVTSVVGNIESMFPFHSQSNLRKQDRRPFKFWFLLPNPSPSHLGRNLCDCFEESSQ